MKTDTLLLKRAMGFVSPEDYIEWAVMLLCEGFDSRNLRILAGLNKRYERDEIESYFNETCKDLNIETIPESVGPRYTAGLVKKSYDNRDLTAKEALDMMADLYDKSGYSDPLLTVWYDIEEELSMEGCGYGGCFYPPNALDSLDKTFEREWSLFERACAIDLPENFYRFIRCDKCSHIGEAVFKYKTIADKLRSKLPIWGSKPALWATCGLCGSYDYHGMSDPEVREDYYKRIEGKLSL